MGFCFFSLSFEHCIVWICWEFTRTSTPGEDCDIVSHAFLEVATLANDLQDLDTNYCLTSCDSSKVYLICHRASESWMWSLLLWTPFIESIFCFLSVDLKINWEMLLCQCFTHTEWMVTSHNNAPSRKLYIISI